MGKDQEKAIRIIKFLPNDAPVLKAILKIKNSKIKRLHYTSLHILFVLVKDLLTNEQMTSINTIFQHSATTHYQNARSANSYQLRKHDFKTEKFGQSFTSLSLSTSFSLHLLFLIFSL